MMYQGFIGTPSQLALVDWGGPSLVRRKMLTKLGDYRKTAVRIGNPGDEDEVIEVVDAIRNTNLGQLAPGDERRWTFNHCGLVVVALVKRVDT